MNRTKFLEIEQLLESYTESEVADLAKVKLWQVKAVRSGEITYESCGPPERCDDCGGMVYKPCIFCSVRTERNGRAA